MATKVGCGLGEWQTLNADLAATADTAANLLDPLVVTGDRIRVVQVPYMNSGSKALLERAPYFLLRGAVDSSATATTTSPVIRVYGVDAEVNDDGTWDGTESFVRLDNADNTAAGITLTFESTISTTTMLSDDDNFYTDVEPDLTGFSTQNCKYVFALVETAGNLTGDSTLIAQIKFTL